MKLSRLKYTLSFVFLVFLGCDDSPIPQKNSDIYFRIVVNAENRVKSNSINEATDFDDHVHSLFMLVFDSNSGEKLAEHFLYDIETGGNPYVFTTKLSRGERDFFFIANMDGAYADISAINSKTEMDNFMERSRRLDVSYYTGALKNKGFPMSRVYLRQTISSGGPLSDPIQFKPGGEDCVNLERVVAKLEVKILAGEENLQKIELFNANRDFRLIHIKDEPSELSPIVNLKWEGTSGKWIAYMPEIFVPANKGWIENEENKPINFLRLTTKGKQVYDIPIITHDGPIPEGDYIKFAKGSLSAKPIYSLFRNHCYCYNIKKVSDKIEIEYSVSDWTKLYFETYMGHGYNVIVDDNKKVTISNTMNNCSPHEVKLSAVNGAYFENDPSNTEVLFTHLANGASETYSINNDRVNTGQVYMQVLYNQVLKEEFKKTE